MLLDRTQVAEMLHAQIGTKSKQKTRRSSPKSPHPPQYIHFPTGQSLHPNQHLTPLTELSHRAVAKLPRQLHPSLPGPTLADGTAYILKSAALLSHQGRSKSSRSPPC